MDLLELLQTLFEEMSIIGSISFTQPNRVVVDFEGLDFLIAVEPIPMEPNADINSNNSYRANISFMSGDPPVPCDIPSQENIRCIDNDNNINVPLLFNRGYTVNLSSNYDVTYHGVKIFGLRSEKKRFTIHNFRRTDSLERYRKKRKNSKASQTLEKCFNMHDDDDNDDNISSV